MKKNLIAAALIASMGLALTGCGGDNTVPARTISDPVTTAAVEETTAVTTAAETTTVESEVKGAADEKIIGTKAEGDNVYTAKVTNKTGKAITSISFKSPDDEDYTENKLPEGETYAKDETRMLYLETSGDKTGYQMLIKYDDDTSWELHDLPLKDMESFELRLEDEITFIAYKSVSSGEEMNTKENESGYKPELLDGEDETAPAQNEDPDLITPPESPAPAETPVQTAPPVTEPVVVQTTASGGDSCIGNGGLFNEDPQPATTAAVDNGNSCIGDGGLFNDDSSSSGGDSCIGDGGLFN